MPFPKNGSFWLSYVFGVIAIAAQIYVFQVAFPSGKNVKSKFYGFPIAKIGVTYLLVQLVLSLVCIVLAAVVPVTLAAVLYVLLLAAAALGFIAADTMREEIERQDAQLKKDVACMQALRSRVYPMSAQCADAQAAEALRKLADEFRYSDPVSGDTLSEAEANLTACVDELQQAVVDGDAQSILALARRTSIALGERNRLCALGKGL
jgi:cytochrome c556